jgi:hypothetical protein
MRSLFLSLFFFLTPLFGAPCKYTITENPYRFSTYFEMDGESYEGRVIKSSISVRTVYDFYDESGDYVAQGICRLLSMGSICSWARTIDIYDAAGNYIGLIDGTAFTTAKASYNFYDGNGTYLGVAYLNLDCSSFLLTDAKERTLATLKRKFVDRAIDHWEVNLYDRNSIDLRLFKIFSAFAIDHQEYFKEDK